MKSLSPLNFDKIIISVSHRKMNSNFLEEDEPFYLTINQFFAAIFRFEMISMHFDAEKINRYLMSDFETQNVSGWVESGRFSIRLKNEIVFSNSPSINMAFPLL